MFEKLRTYWLPSIVTDSRFPEFVFLPVPVQDKSTTFLQTECEISMLNPEAQKIFTLLLKSQEFSEDVEKLEKLLEQQSKILDQNSFRKILAGFLFEALAYDYLKEGIAHNEVLLSPEETFNLYKFIHPEKPTVTHDYGLNLGIDGITVPDGLLLCQREDKTNIVGVCEYSLTSPDYFSEKKQRQLEHYRGRDSVINNVFSFDYPFQGAYQGAYLSEFIHKLHPQLPKKISIDYKNFRTVYVFPRNDDDDYKTTMLEGIETFTLPISRAEFRLVLNGIFQDVEKTNI